MTNLNEPVCLKTPFADRPLHVDIQNLLFLEEQHGLDQQPLQAKKKKKGQNVQITK